MWRMVDVFVIDLQNMYKIGETILVLFIATVYIAVHTLYTPSSRREQAYLTVVKIACVSTCTRALLGVLGPHLPVYELFTVRCFVVYAFVR